MKFSTSTLVRTISAEFIGTFLLVLISCMSFTLYNDNKINLFGLGLINALGSMACIWAFMEYTDSCLSFGVIIVQLVTRSAKVGHLFIKMAVQILASIFAVFISVTLVDDSYFEKHKKMVGYPSLNLKNYTHFQCFLAEFLGSALFLFAFYATVVDKRGPSSVFGFAVGSVILVSTMIFGEISGSAIYFSRVIGAQLLFGDFNDFWIYLVGISFGSFFFGCYYHYFLLNEGEGEDIEEDDFFIEKNMKTIENLNQASSLKY